MMRVVLTLLLMVATAPAWADWMKVDESDNQVVYIDPATIRKDGHLRRVWEIINLKQKGPDGLESMRGYLELDCAEEKRRLLSITAHSGPMASEGLLWSQHTNSEWHYIAPNTAATTILRIVCVP